MRMPSTHPKPPLTAGQGSLPGTRFLRQTPCAVTNRPQRPAVLLQTGACPFSPESPSGPNLRCKFSRRTGMSVTLPLQLARSQNLWREGSPSLSHVAAWDPALVTLLPEPTTNPNPKPGCSPLPIWPCMREAGGRPVLMASLRLPWECRPWLPPLWDSAPGPRFMFWVGGCGQQEVMGRRVSSDNDHHPAVTAGTCPADFPHHGRTCPFSPPVGDLGNAR